MRVLIVDDNESVAELLTDYMRLFGFETDAARDGLEALDKLKNGRFHSVIMDGHMPNMSGFELCRYIKTYFPSIYTIGITDSLSLKKFWEAGADDCFYKPIDCSMLCSRMVTISRNHRRHGIRSGYRSS